MMGSVNTILHIGIGKAGSSSIQRFFSEKRKELYEQNIFYPYDIVQGSRLGGDNHKCLATNCIEYNENHIVFKQQRVRSKKEKIKFERYVVNSYIEQIKEISPSSICILSAEHFWSILTNQKLIVRFRETLKSIGFRVTKIIVYIRDQIQWLKSFTQQKLIEGSVTSLDLSFLSYDFILSRLDYFETIQLWESCFPEAVMAPRIFEREAFESNNLILDFLSASDQRHISKNYIDFDFKQKQNASNLTLEGYLLLAKLNEYEHKSKKKSLNKSGTYTAERKIVIEYLKKNFRGKCNNFFSKSAVLELESLFETSNENTRKTYFPNRNKLFSADSISAALSPVQDVSRADLVEYLYELIVFDKEAHA